LKIDTLDGWELHLAQHLCGSVGIRKEGWQLAVFSLRIGFGDRTPLKKITTRPYR
jgi:hypothetical protein